MGILETAIEITQRHRPEQYGHPLDHFSKTIGMINAAFEDIVRKRLEAGEPMFQAEDWPRFMIMDKLARSLKGYQPDNMVDVAGYANTHEMVVEERKWRAAK